MARNAEIEALVLAAGSSRRLGRPKALLDFDGRSALGLVLDALRAANLARGVVVLGAERAEIEAAVTIAPLRPLENSDPDAGRTGSILVGLEALDSGREVLFWPVDRPLASAATVVAMLEASATAPDSAGVVLPETDGGRGHPFVLRAAALSIVRRASADANLRELLSDVERLEVGVNDPGIHHDLDTEKDYRRALAWWRGLR